MKYIKQTVLATSYTCSHYGTISQQLWALSRWDLNVQLSGPQHNPLRLVTCQHFQNTTLWIKEEMYYPDSGNAPFPNPEMPESVKKFYLEASSIHMKSPRGAAALLRLGIQVLCKELGEKGEKINSDIASLVKKGLPEIVQQSLDIVRVTGNDAVHPGQIDTDNAETVAQLFELTNVIIEYMIALPKKVS